MAAKKRFGLVDTGDAILVAPGNSNTAVVETVVKPTGERTYGEISLTLLQPNPYQPRMRPNEKKLQELAYSMRENGLIEAIVVRQSEHILGEYEIVCGHRRVKAAKLLKWERIRAEILSTCSDCQMQLIAVIENDQREDLHPLEVAAAYTSLLQMVDASGKRYTVRSLGKALGKNKDHIQMVKDLLTTPEDVKALFDEFPGFPIRLANELADLPEGDRAYLIDEYREHEIKAS